MKKHFLPAVLVGTMSVGAAAAATYIRPRPVDYLQCPDVPNWLAGAKAKKGVGVEEFACAIRERFQGSEQIARAPYLVPHVS